MNLLQQLFFSLKGRERLLLFAFFAALLLLWLSALLKSGREQWTEYSQWRGTYDAQEPTITSAPTVDEDLKAALSRLDSNRTHSATQLFGQLDNIARSFDLKFDVSQPVSRNSGIYTTHNVRVRVDDSNLEQLVRFNEAVQAETPYIAITEFKLSANRRDQSKIDATFDIASFELLENYTQ
jgi:hypothetical protein